MKKSIDSWKVLENILLNVNSVDLQYKIKKEELHLNCSFDNIAKGRCKLIISYSKKRNEIFIFSDKAMMEGNINVSMIAFNKLLNYFKSAIRRTTKIKLTLSEGLLINKKGYLYIQENTRVLILDYAISFPVS